MSNFLTRLFSKQTKAIAIRDVTPSEYSSPDDENAYPNTLKPKAVQNPTIIFHSIGKPNQRRGLFDAAEYNLYEISKIDDVDSYVHQAFNKKVGLFLKEGFDYVGTNKKIVNYIKTRLQQIALGSDIPTRELIRRLVSQFIKKSNAFLIKVRDKNASGGAIRTDINGSVLEPIAGYFPCAPETMEADVDITGHVNMWRQRLPSGIIKEFPPEDVIHFTFDRKEGLIFGTPILTPVIDDLRALRAIEENIELLVYKHLFPMFQYIVGTEQAPAGLTEDGFREIDIVRREIQFMPSEGGIVTPERHEIKMIGAESKALRAESYLEHFKRRVFSGLGMSAVDFGESDSSNRSTADNMSRALIDDIKNLQDAFEVQFNHFIIGELLLESTFPDTDLFSDENRVDICFREIDIDKQIKVESHAADLFLKNGTCWDEFREALGRDPISVPDDPEDQDINKYPEWHRTFWKLFNEPEKYIVSTKGQLYSAATIAAANHPSTTMTQGDVQSQQKAQEEADVNLAVEKEKAKPKPVKKKDNFLLSDYDVLRELAVNTKSIDYLSSKFQTISVRMINILKTNMNTAFLQGLGPINNNLLVKVSTVRRTIEQRSNFLINRLITDILNSIKRRQIDTQVQGDKISNINTIFDSFKYRIDFISETETNKARNLGTIIKFLNSGALQGKLITADDTCESCKNHAERLLSLDLVSLSDIPPHHNKCKCGLEVA